MKYLTWFLLIVIVGGGIWVLARPLSPREQDTDTLTEERDGRTKQEIRNQVIAFGATLKDVSLLSPTAPQDIERVYAPYVTRSLRAAWSANPDRALLGRLTSSPWPERIDVVDIDQTDDVYEVRGFVVSMTSDELTNGGDAGSAEIIFLVREEDGAWKIDSTSVIRENDPNAPRSERDLPKLE